MDGRMMEVGSWAAYSTVVSFCWPTYIYICTVNAGWSAITTSLVETLFFFRRLAYNVYIPLLGSIWEKHTSSIISCCKRKNPPSHGELTGRQEPPTWLETG